MHPSNPILEDISVNLYNERVIPYGENIVIFQYL